jgi:hypothetical protein
MPEADQGFLHSPGQRSRNADAENYLNTSIDFLIGKWYILTMTNKRKPLPAKHPIDRAVNTMLRALDKRLACASGMPWYETDARRVNAIRKALLYFDAVPYDTKNLTARQLALYKEPYTSEEALQTLADSLKAV